MGESLYLAMAGAKQSMIAQTINTNNLANVNTPGFKADLYNANKMAILGEGVPEDVYVTSEKPIADFTPGAIHTTGRDLDVAVQGKGWLSVQRPDGSEAYTRAGSLQLTPTGQLQTASGYAVLGNGGPIAIPPSSVINIAKDGTITVRPQGQDEKSLATIDRLKLVNPDEALLSKGIDGLFEFNEGQVAEADANVSVVSNALETSNVNPAGAMVNIIALARQFEMQIKVMQQTEDNGDILAQLLQI